MDLNVLCFLLPPSLKDSYPGHSVLIQVNDFLFRAELVTSLLSSKPLIAFLAHSLGALKMEVAVQLNSHSTVLKKETLGKLWNMKQIFQKSGLATLMSKQ